MPWQENSVMDNKVRFALESIKYNGSFRELCNKYKIAPKTGYKFKRRFIKNGIEGLKESSRRPLRSPKSMTEDQICKIIMVKNKKKYWGPSKIRERFKDEYPEERLPSLSTFERVLKKSGYTKPRGRRRSKAGVRLVCHAEPKRPNDMWTVDFKGWWYTSKKEQVNPLTVRDEYSKFIFCIKAMEKGNIEHVKAAFIELFKEYGLPKIIKSDNGTPFASNKNIMGLSQLSVWWLSLGINLHRIKPASPYQNGAHERMHLDMARELETRVYGKISTYQSAFEIWRKEFNDERPHEALGMKKPSQLYYKSERRYYENLKDFEYPVNYQVRKVANRGSLSFDCKRYFVGRPFEGYHVGLHKQLNRINVYFGKTLLGYFDKDTLDLVPGS